MKIGGFLSSLGEAFDTLKISPAIIEQTQNYIADVETKLKIQIGSAIPLVENVGQITLRGGGKRLRPALVFLSARSTGLEFDYHRAVQLGVAMELIHMATLIHDDVIDDAATRRGEPTAFSIHGITPSILGGDVLLAKAMRLLAEDGDLRIIRLVSQAVVELAEGEVQEIAVRGDINLSLDDHLSVLRMKTASFIECCCRIGGMLTDSAQPQLDALGNYGHHLGMAFQIVDDILDFRGDAAKTGKPVATDFRDGQVTLPLIYLLTELSPEEKTFVEKKFGNGSTNADLQLILSWMNDRKALARADQDAREHASSARESLELLPDSGERRLLSGVTLGVTRRQS
ncbi:MAG: polyprenyl synthetase family protein [Fimbriimonadaceae bacterium]